MVTIETVPRKDGITKVLLPATSYRPKPEAGSRKLVAGS
jgi:hypothetical protein